MKFVRHYSPEAHRFVPATCLIVSWVDLIGPRVGLIGSRAPGLIGLSIWVVVG